MGERLEDHRLSAARRAFDHHAAASVEAGQQHRLFGRELPPRDFGADVDLRGPRLVA
jgi:hypothetical protein